jgi:hypothetical protein
VGVHLTADGFEVEGFFRRHHKVQYNFSADCA